MKQKTRSGYFNWISAYAGMTILFGVAPPSPIFAVPKVIPVINGQFFTGQWYFDGEKSALGGNAGLTFVPAISYTNRFSVIPTFSSSYRGTRSAEELAGGSTLFQDTWENGASVKFVHGLSEHWKLRENVGAKMKWFRETTDESWSDGLYDYRTYQAGVELEHQWTKKLSASLGYDFSILGFTNYESLEVSGSSATSREFSSKHPLDAQIHLFSTRMKAPLRWNMKAQVQGFYSPRYYRDQTVVLLSGLLSPEERKDEYVGATAALERPFRLGENFNLIPNVYYGYSSLDSTQNHYDARKTQFIAHYYNYDQNRVGSAITLAVRTAANQSITFDTGYSYSRRDYRNRPVQNSSSDYLTEKLYIEETSLDFGFSYPLSKDFRLRTTATFGHSKSNNQYEAVYRYNYSNANYLFGFTYDY